MGFVGLLTFSASMDFIIGLGLILVPVQFLAMYNITLDNSSAGIARLLGVAFLQMGIITWIARGFSAHTQAIATALSLGNAIGVLVALFNQFSGGVGPMGWSNVLIYGFFTVAFGMFAFGKNRSTAS